MTGGAGWLHQVLAQYGYLAVFALVGLESAGVPLPGETMLVTAAIYAGSTGRLSLAGVLAAAISGAVLGDNAGYAAGRYGGWPLLARYGRYVRLREKDLKTGRYLFARHGGTVVFFGRFVSILRICAAFLAGANRMRWPRFAVFNAAGGITWAAGWGIAAYSYGTALQHASATIGVLLAAAGLCASIAAAFWLRRRWRQLETAAEAACPGPFTQHAAAPGEPQQTVPASVLPAGGKQTRPCQR